MFQQLKQACQTAGLGATDQTVILKTKLNTLANESGQTIDEYEGGSKEQASVPSSLENRHGKGNVVAAEDNRSEWEGWEIDNGAVTLGGKRLNERGGKGIIH